MDPLTIALAIYGGYQGYTSAKKAHANTLGQLFATAAGAYGGYNLGSGIGALGSAAGETAATNIGVGETINAGVNNGIGALYNASAVDPYATTSLGMDTNAALSQSMNQAPIEGIKTLGASQPQFQQLQPTIMNAGYEQSIMPQNVRTLSDTGEVTYENQWRPGPNGNVQVTPVSATIPEPDNPYKPGGKFYQPEQTQVPTGEDIARQNRLGELRAAEEARVSAQRAAQAPYNISGIDDLGQVGRTVDYGQYNPPQTMSEKLSGYGSKAGDILGKTFYDEKDGIKVGNAALVGVPAALYASGAFERKPYERSMFTYNVNYPDLYRNRTFQVQDPKTGQVYNMPQQSYIPEEKARAGITNPNQQFGPYKREVLTLNQGGLASLAYFKDGGVTYLPSKVQNDETNEDSYVRANGYVEDPTGSGSKNEDTMLAQLADGEFVTRTDGVLGAGILAGANPDDEKQMRKMGADFFYEQQKRFKRIFDLLDASRKATAH
jgi:hypothetical protein